MALVQKFAKLSDEQLLARRLLLVDLIKESRSLEKVILIQQRLNIEAEMKNRNILSA